MKNDLISGMQIDSGDSMKVKISSTLLLFVVICLTISLVQVFADQNDVGSGGDAGDNIESAALMEKDSGSGFTSSTIDKDFIKFPVSEDEEVSVEVSTKNGNFLFTLYDTNQQNVDYTNINPNETPETMSWTASDDGYFYIEVKMKTGTSATYTIKLTRHAEGAQGLESARDNLNIPGFRIEAVIIGVALSGLYLQRRSTSLL